MIALPPLVVEASEIGLPIGRFPMFCRFDGVDYQADRRVYDPSGEDLVSVIYVRSDGADGAELHVVND